MGQFVVNDRSAICGPLAHNLSRNLYINQLEGSMSMTLTENEKREERDTCPE
jgi:hypothetical protein